MRRKKMKDPLRGEKSALVESSERQRIIKRMVQIYYKV